MAYFPSNFKTNLKAWLIGDTIVGLQDGGVPANWVDMSGNGNDISNWTGSGVTTPVKAEGVANGHSALYFDGTNCCYSTNTMASFISNQQFCMFVVFKAETYGVQEGIIGGSTTVSGGLYLDGAAGTGTLTAWHNDGATDTRTETFLYGGTASDWHIGMIRHTGGNLYSGLDHVSSVGAGTASGNTSATTGVFRIGQYAGAGGAYFNGWIPEIMVFSAGLDLRPTTRGTCSVADVFSYLAAKYLNAGEASTALGAYYASRADGIEQSRAVSSRELWLKRRPAGRGMIAVPLKFGDYDILTDFRVSSVQGLDPHGGGAGWPEGKTEGRLMRLMARELDLDNLTVGLDLRDERNVRHNYQESLTATRSLRPDRQGCMQTGKVVHAYTRSGDSCVRVPGTAASYSKLYDCEEKIQDDGTLLESAAKNVLTRSSFVSSSSGCSSVGLGVGGSNIEMDTADYIFDTSIQPTPQSVKFTAGSPHSTDLYLRRQTAADYFTDCRVRILHKDDSGQALSYSLQRTVDSLYWNASSSWGAARTWNTITASTSVADFFSDSIGTAVAWSSGIAYLDIGFPNGATAASIAHLYHSEIRTGTPTIPGALIVTESSAVYTDPDVLQIIDCSTEAQGVLNQKHGTLRFKYTPLYNSTDTSAGASIYLFQCGDTTAYNSLRLTWEQATTALTLSAQAGTSVWVSATAAYTPVRGTESKIAVRWTGDEGELGLSDNTLSVFAAGVKGTDAQTTATLTGFGSPLTWSDARELGISGSPNTPSGRIASLKSVPFCLTDEEIAAW